MQKTDQRSQSPRSKNKKSQKSGNIAKSIFPIYPNSRSTAPAGYIRIQFLKIRQKYFGRSWLAWLAWPRLGLGLGPRLGLRLGLRLGPRPRPPLGMPCLALPDPAQPLGAPAWRAHSEKIRKIRFSDFPIFLRFLISLTRILNYLGRFLASDSSRINPDQI